MSFFSAPEGGSEDFEWPRDGKARMSLTIDPVTGNEILTFCLLATYFEPNNKKLSPQFIIKARKKNSVSVMLENFLFVRERFFFRRGLNTAVGLQCDNAPVQAIKPKDQQVSHRCFSKIASFYQPYLNLIAC